MRGFATSDSRSAAPGAIRIRRDALVLDGDRGVVGIEPVRLGTEDRHVAIDEERRVRSR